jgi:hypothetical protein
MLSRKTFLCCLAPPSPRLFPPFPQPVIVSLSWRINAKWYKIPTKPSPGAKWGA